MKTYWWAKLWIDMLDDPKIMKLPDSLRWRFVECILLAKELDASGMLPPISDMAWRVRITDDTMSSDLSRLALNSLVELIDYNGEDRWFITNFAKRQEEPIPDAERMRAYRKRKRMDELSNADATPTQRDSYDTVTTRNTEERREENKRRGEKMKKAATADSFTDFLKSNGIDDPDNPEDAELAKHPSVIAWMTVTNRWPTWAGVRAIVKRIGDKPDVAALQEEYDLWLAAGYNPGNISGLLERYERRTRQTAKAESRSPQPSTTGHVGGF